jgi:hypothetical protein
MRSSRGLHGNSICLALTAVRDACASELPYQKWLVSPRGSDWELSATRIADAFLVIQAGP